MKTTYKAILFDLFGTLLSVSKEAKGQGQFTADILGLERKAWNQTCFSEHHDIVSSTDHLEIVRRIAHSLDPSIPLDKVRQATDARQLRFDTALLEIEPGILSILQELKQQGFILGLISNASTGEVSAWPESPLAPLFTSVHFSCQQGVQKPDPEIYQMALAEMAITADSALFIGDGSSEEHSGAEACNIDSLLVTYFL
ncbi:MAG: HAD family hydrolase, partial [Candidatus Thiodiazotropha taylori]|nr:HAD family hydrolase [Candidatus Thiodiazotropha taylori]MCW4291748.1 HAD family hydrolase [Candidatus Thiodiazotropha taylori]